MAASFMSPADYAAHSGRHRSRICRFIKEGKIPAEAVEGRGRAMRIDVTRADAALRRLDPGQQLARVLKAGTQGKKAAPPRQEAGPKVAASPKPGRNAPQKLRRAPEPEPATPEDATATETDGDDPNSIDFAVQKARLAKEQADAQAMKNAIARDELLKADEVARRWSTVLSGMRSAMLTLTSRARDALPHLTPTDLAKIDAEVRLILKGLSDGQFASG